MKERLKRFKLKLCIIFKVIGRYAYYLATACIPLIIYVYFFLLEKSIIYAGAISFSSLTLMDIICSNAEELSSKIAKYIRNKKRRIEKIKEEQKKKKEEELKQIKELLIKEKNYKNEINEISDSLIDFEEEVNNADISKYVKKGLITTCNKMKKVIEVLEQDPEGFYPIRHTFRIYFPEFKKMTYKYINIAKSENLEKEDTEDFLMLIKKFNVYLDFIKSSINTSDKLSLNVGIRSLITIMEAEVKKGEK